MIRIVLSSGTEGIPFRDPESKQTWTQKNVIAYLRKKHSLGDIYYAIIGKIKGLYSQNFVVAAEGLYLMEVSNETANAVKDELHTLLFESSDEESWYMPAEPTFNPDGTHKGFNWHGEALCIRLWPRCLRLTILIYGSTKLAKKQ